MGFKEKLALTLVRTKFMLLSIVSKRKAAESAFALFCTPQFRNTKELTPLFRQAEQLEFAFHDFQIRGYRWNAKGKKMIQILHGFESSVINFEHYVQPLIDKGYCVLAFDAPAHGRSSGKRTNVLEYKDFIRYIFDHYGPVTNYICHSLGGLSLSLALEEIEHDSHFRVALIAPATETRTAIDHLFKVLQLNPSLRAPFDQVIADKSGHAPEWFSVVRALQHVRAQVLWVHDQDDDMTPLSDAIRIRDHQLLNIHFVVTKGLGHRRIYRDQQVVQQILNFFD